jgi:hypothetical protein
MDYSLSWEANSFSASLQIPLWPLLPILSQINPVCALLPYFLKDHFNITLPSTPRSSKLVFFGNEEGALFNDAVSY